VQIGKEGDSLPPSGHPCARGMRGPRR
jgi:hypothetical protein